MSKSKKRERRLNRIVTQSLQQGDYHFSKRHYENAELCYTSAIRHFHKLQNISENDYVLLSKIYSGRSAAFLRLKKFRTAMHDADKSIRYNSNHFAGYLRKADILIKTGKKPEALKFLKDVHSQHPSPLFETYLEILENKELVDFIQNTEPITSSQLEEKEERLRRKIKEEQKKMMKKKTEELERKKKQMQSKNKKNPTKPTLSPNKLHLAPIEKGLVFNLDILRRNRSNKSISDFLRGYRSAIRAMEYFSKGSLRPAFNHVVRAIFDIRRAGVSIFPERYGVMFGVSDLSLLDNPSDNSKREEIKKFVGFHLLSYDINCSFGDFTDANEAIKRCIELDPTNPILYIFRGETESELFHPAENILRTYIDGIELCRTLLTGEEYVDEDYMKEKSVGKENKKIMDSYHVEGKISSDGSKFSLSKSEVQEVSRDLVFKAGLAFSETKKHFEAVEYLKRYLKLTRPGNFYNHLAHYALSFNLSKLQKWKESTHYFVRGFESEKKLESLGIRYISPMSSESLKHRAALLLQMNGMDSNIVRCDYCKRRGVILYNCGRCKKVSYCDKNCQQKAWKEHSTVCNKSASPASPPSPQKNGPTKFGSSDEKKMTTGTANSATGGEKTTTFRSSLRFIQRLLIQHEENLKKKMYERRQKDKNVTLSRPSSFKKRNKTKLLREHQREVIRAKKRKLLSMGGKGGQGQKENKSPGEGEQGKKKGKEGNPKGRVVGKGGNSTSEEEEEQEINDDEEHIFKTDSTEKMKTKSSAISFSFLNNSSTSPPKKKKKKRGMDSKMEEVEKEPEKEELDEEEMILKELEKSQDRTESDRVIEEFEEDCKDDPFFLLNVSKFHYMNMKKRKEKTIQKLKEEKRKQDEEEKKLGEKKEPEDENSETKERSEENTESQEKNEKEEEEEGEGDDGDFFILDPEVENKMEDYLKLTSLSNPQNLVPTLSLLDEMNTKLIDTEQLRKKKSSTTSSPSQSPSSPQKSNSSDPNKSELTLSKLRVMMGDKTHNPSFEEIPIKSHSLKRLATHFFERGKYDRALHWFESYVKIVKNDPYAFCCLAVIYSEAGEYEKAEKLCDKALQMNGKLFSVYYTRGVVRKAKFFDIRAIEKLGQSHYRSRTDMDVGKENQENLEKKKKKKKKKNYTVEEQLKILDAAKEDFLKSLEYCGELDRVKVIKEFQILKEYREIVALSLKKTGMSKFLYSSFSSLLPSNTPELNGGYSLVSTVVHLFGFSFLVSIAVCFMLWLLYFWGDGEL